MSNGPNRHEKAGSLQQAELDHFRTDGLVMHCWRLRPTYVRELVAAVASASTGGEGMVLEENGRAIRALHGLHEREPFRRLVRFGVLLNAARSLLHDDVYVYQSKLNFKAAFAGDLWPWHQDYSFWEREDGMPTPNALTAAIFLDDVTEFNGPIYFIPRSHLDASADTATRAFDATSWTQHVSASLSYQTHQDEVTRLVGRHGLVAPKAARGSILFFHSNIVHASPPNISPLPRRLLLITYNAVRNVPAREVRPAFLVSRDKTPLEELDCTEWIEPVRT